MKKLVLSAALLFSVSCLWNTQGMAECSKEKPFYVGNSWENDNCPEFNIHQLTEFQLLELSNWEEIPDYQYDPAKDSADLLPKLEKIRKKISDMKKNQENLIKTIQAENLKIEEENQKIQEKNKFFSEKQEIIEGYYGKCRLGFGELLVGGFDDNIVNLRLNVDTSNLQEYLKSTELVIINNLKKAEKDISKIKDTNIDILFDNMKREYKNNLKISEFEKFYTPEKEKQLLEEYEKAVSEHCVGCDYPDLNEYQCGECPNREYMDGKCIFKKEGK